MKAVKICTLTPSFLTDPQFLECSGLSQTAIGESESVSPDAAIQPAQYVLGVLPMFRCGLHGRTRNVAAHYSRSVVDADLVLHWSHPFQFAVSCKLKVMKAPILSSYG